MASILADGPLDDDGDVLLCDLLDDLYVDPVVVGGQEGVIVPELRRRLREACVIDVQREVVAGLWDNSHVTIAEDMYTPKVVIKSRLVSGHGSDRVPNSYEGYPNHDSKKPIQFKEVAK